MLFSSLCFSTFFCAKLKCVHKRERNFKMSLWRRFKKIATFMWSNFVTEEKIVLDIMLIQKKIAG